MAEQVDSTTYGNTYASACEVFTMWSNPPERVFCYPSTDDKFPITWMGHRLGGSISAGPRYRDNFGGVRQSVSFIGLSGHRYSGTLFDTYIRAKRCK